MGAAAASWASPRAPQDQARGSDALADPRHLEVVHVQSAHSQEALPEGSQDRAGTQAACRAGSPLALEPRSLQGVQGLDLDSLVAWHPGRLEAFSAHSRS